MSKKIGLAVLAVTAVLAGGPVAQAREIPASPAAVSPAQDALVARLSTIIDQARMDSPEGARALVADLLPIVNDPVFAEVDLGRQSVVHVLLGGAHLILGQYEDSHAALIRAADVWPEITMTPFFNYTLAMAAKATGRDAEAASALAALFDSDPANSLKVADQFLQQVSHRARLLEDSKPYHRLLEALWQADHHLQNPVWTMQTYWWDLFELRVAAGDEVGARELAPQLIDAKYVVAVRADNRYRRFADGLPSRGEYRVAYLQERANTQARAAAHPESMEGQRQVAEYLASDGAFAEALALLDATLARAADYSDQADQTSWALEDRAGLLGALGRADEETAERGKARDAALAAGGDTVSQALNLSEHYNAIDRPDLALKELDSVDLTAASPYGQMVAASARVCAYQQLNDQPQVKTWLDYVTVNRLEGPAMYRSAIACTGDMDGLAAIVIAELDDPKTRNLMLRGLQTYDPPLGVQTAYRRRMRATNEAIRMRADVRAAVSKYGSIETYSRSGTP